MFKPRTMLVPSPRPANLNERLRPAISRRALQSLARADFLTSVGLCLMRDRLIMVRLRKNFQSITLLEQEVRELPAEPKQQAIAELTGWITEDVREIALKAENDSRERSLREALLSLLPHFNRRTDHFCLSISQEEVIVHPFFLPQAAESNLAQVVDYEIERQMPFRREDLFYDFVPLGRTGDKIGVCVFAIPKKNLVGVLEVLASFGIRPGSIEGTAVSLANLVAFCKGEAPGPAAAIGGLNGTCEIVGVRTQPSGLTEVHEMVFSYRLKAGDWSAGPAKELLLETLNGARELYGWGEIDEILRSAKIDPPEYEDLLVLANRRLKGTQEITDAQLLPAVGAALGGLREASFAVDFLRREGGNRSRARALSRLNLGLGALLVLGMIGLGISYPIKDELRLRQLQRVNQKLEPAVAALRHEETQLQGLRKELDFLADQEAKTGQVLRVLDELTKTVPSNAYLSNLRFRGGVVEIQGSAENASGLIPLLERSPMFENVGFNAPSNRGRDNRETFSLKAELEKRKETAR
ncbi:MAG TPA: PilN domain-containing protein [Candidatus Eisenbacteria bacterium]|nr:PilN domain-containing protein [Candidatus Eisenbacteria bacterium]